MFFDDLGAPAGDDENLADTRRDDAGDNVFEIGLPCTRSMGLGNSL